MSNTSFQGRVPVSDPHSYSSSQVGDQQCANQSKFTQSCTKDDEDIDKDKKKSDQDTNKEKEENTEVKEPKTMGTKVKLESLQTDKNMRHRIFASSSTTEGRLLGMSMENDQKGKIKALEDKVEQLKRQHKIEIQGLKAEIQALNDQANQAKKEHLYEIENLKTKLSEENQDLTAEISTTPNTTEQIKNQHCVEEFAERNHKYRKDYIASIKASEELKQHGRELTLTKFKECGMERKVCT